MKALAVAVAGVLVAAQAAFAGQTDDLGFPLITVRQIHRVHNHASEQAVFRILGGKGDRSSRYDTTYAHLPDFDECFAYGRVGNPNAQWEFCFRTKRLVFKRHVPSS